MSIDLAPDIWNEIQRQLASGSYASHDEVLREALAALRSREAEVVAIQEGIDDMEAGRVRPLHEFDREFRHRNNLPVAELCIKHAAGVSHRSPGSSVLRRTLGKRTHNHQNPNGVSQPMVVIVSTVV